MINIDIKRGKKNTKKKHLILHFKKAKEEKAKPEVSRRKTRSGIDKIQSRKQEMTSESRRFFFFRR